MSRSYFPGMGEGKLNFQFVARLVERPPFAMHKVRSSAARQTQCASSSVISARLFAAAAFFGFLSIIVSPASAEGWVEPPIDGGTQLHRDLSIAGLNNLVTTLKEANRIIVDIEVTPIGTNEAGQPCQGSLWWCAKFHVISTQNTDDLDWALIKYYELTDYADAWTAQRDSGKRLADLEIDKVIFRLPGTPLAKSANIFVGLFIDNPENTSWYSYAKLSQQEFNQKIREHVKDDGLILVDGGKYTEAKFSKPDDNSAKHRYAVFLRDASNRKSVPAIALTNQEYQALREELVGDAYRPVWLSEGEGDQRIARDSSWLQDPGTAAKVLTRLSAEQLSSFNTEFAAEGFTLIDVERTDSSRSSSSQQFWAAVWHKEIDLGVIPPISVTLPEESPDQTADAGSIPTRSNPSKPEKTTRPLSPLYIDDADANYPRYYWLNENAQRLKNAALDRRTSPPALAGAFVALDMVSPAAREDAIAMRFANLGRRAASAQTVKVSIVWTDHNESDPGATTFEFTSPTLASRKVAWIEIGLGASRREIEALTIEGPYGGSTVMVELTNETLSGRGRPNPRVESDRPASAATRN